MTTDAYVDGNQLAGMLQEFLTTDVTVARGPCMTCGQMNMMAEMRVYNRSAGMVARCPNCESVLMRVVRGPGRVFLDMTGMVHLELTTPANTPTEA